MPTVTVDEVVRAFMLGREQHGWARNYGWSTSTGESIGRRAEAEMVAEKEVLSRYGSEALALLHEWKSERLSCGWQNNYGAGTSTDSAAANRDQAERAAVSSLQARRAAAPPPPPPRPPPAAPPPPPEPGRVAVEAVLKNAGVGEYYRRKYMDELGIGSVDELTRRLDGVRAKMKAEHYTKLRELLRPSPTPKPTPAPSWAGSGGAHTEHDAALTAALQASIADKPGNARLTPTAEELSAVPTLKLPKPSRTCAEELASPALAARLPGAAELVADCEFKAQQLAYEALPVALPADELLALVAYTHDNQSGVAAGNLYYELNRALRQRGSSERAAALRLWGGVLHYLLSALSRLPDLEVCGYRGYPDKKTVLAQYKLGRPVQWGAFSSMSTDVEVTRNFTSAEDGVIFKLSVKTGKRIAPYSYFPSEEEVLLSPQTRFVVSSAPYVAADGYTYLDLVETQGTVLHS